MRLLLPPGLLQRSRIKIGIAILLLIANGVIYLVAIVPAHREGAKLTAEVTRLASTIQPDQDAGTENLASQFAANDQDLATFSNLLLPREDFDRFLGELFEFSSRAGLLLDRIHYQPKAQGQHQVLEYRLRFNLNGSYEQIRQFVHLLEDSPRLIAIRTLSLAGEPSSEGRISVGMELDTYFRMEAK